MISSHRARVFPLKYVALIFGFIWTFWWLAVLQERGLVSLPVLAGFLAAFGPMLAAKSDRRLGKRTSLGRLLARPGLRWRVAPIW